MKFYKCNGCGKIVEMVKGSACPTKCCGEAMDEIVAGSVDAAVEKHVPVVAVEGNKITVTVGSVEHPMTEAHLIEWIVLETENGEQKKQLKAGEKPVAVFALADGDAYVNAYAYCNLHGLWAAK